MSFFKDKEFLKKVVALSIPIALQNLITSILNIFDQLMVGSLPENADLCLSAVLLANQVVFIYQILLFAASNTANIFIAQYFGNGRKDKIPSTIGFLLINGAVMCALATALCAAAPSFVIGLFAPDPAYSHLAEEFLRVVSFSFIPMCFSVILNFVMRGIKRMKVGLTANVIAVLCNIVLNYVFMFGAFGIPAMGLVGAAYGTIFSRIIELIVMLAGIIVFKYPLFDKPKKMLSFERPFMAQFYKMFFPILCNEIFWVLSGTVFLFVYDKIPDNEIALAAMNIAQSVDKIVSVVMIGIGTAAGIVIGNVLGTGDVKKGADYAHKSMAFSVFAGVIIGILTVGLAFFAPMLFGQASDQTKHTATVLLLLFAATAILRSMSYMAVIGVLRAGGDTTYCMLWETLAIWLVSVPLVIVCGIIFQQNIYVLYVLGNVCEIIKCIIFCYRIKSKKWLKFVYTSMPEPTPVTE